MCGHDLGRRRANRCARSCASNTAQRDPCRRERPNERVALARSVACALVGVSLSRLERRTTVSHVSVSGPPLPTCGSLSHNRRCAYFPSRHVPHRSSRLSSPCPAVHEERHSQLQRRVAHRPATVCSPVSLLSSPPEGRDLVSRALTSPIVLPSTTAR